MRKIIGSLVVTSILYSMPAFTSDTPNTPSAPPDSEMVYRTNLGRADDIDLLIKQGGSVRAVDNNGIGLLFLAAARKDPEGLSVLHKIIENGIDINSRDNSGRTALFYAARSGNPDMVQFLLDSGVDAYATDRNGEMARNYAYKAGNTEIVNLMDSFARKKVEQVNSQYEQINRDLLKRYKELEDQQNKSNKAISKAQQAQVDAEQKKAEAERQAILDKRAAEWQLAFEKAKLAAAQTGAAAPSAPAPLTPATSTATTPAPATNTVPAPAPVTTNNAPAPVVPAAPAPAAPAPATPSPEETAATKIDEDIRSSLTDAVRKRDMENKIIEEEQQDKRAQAELERKIAEEMAAEELSEQLKKEEAEQQATQKAAEELEDKINDAQMQSYMKAEIEAEAARIAIEEQERLRKDPAQRKALLAEKQKKETDRNAIYRDLAYNNCVFQYWYYCYTSGMTTELKGEDLRTAIETSKQKIADLQDTLINDYDVDPKGVKRIGGSAKKRVFDQLDIMKSARERRSRGVGNVADMEKRCSDISLHWDVGAGSVVTERPKPVVEDNNSGATTPTPSSQQPAGLNMTPKKF